MACIVFGIVVAFLLYRGTRNFRLSTRRILFAIRALLISIMAFLLMAPLVKTIEERLEKPLIILALDNSSSILCSKSSNFDPKSYLQQIKKLQDELSADYDLKTLEFDSEVRQAKDLKFNGRQTDISALFSFINDQYANRNVGAIILASDGIINKGANPQFETTNFKTPIYSIALGDTVSKRDLLISNVNYNEIAFLDNEFEIEITVEAFQSAGSKAQLNVSSASGNIFSKSIAINSNDFRQNIKVLIPAPKLGMQQVNFQLSNLSNELSLVNNRKSIFVEVINSKKKILIIANSPHPDISAIKQSIDNIKNYNLKLVFAQEFKVSDARDADLVILHQLPSTSNRAESILAQLKDKAKWFILGSQSDISAFNSSQPILSINNRPIMQEVLASFKPDFYAFTISDESKLKIQNFSPLIAPSGSYNLKGQADVLINQEIARSVSNLPLLVFAESNALRTGILTAEGFWRWRLEDFQENSNHNASDELIQKSLQYLASSDDRRKFRVYNSKNAFDETEPIVLNAELYNDAFELVNNSDVDISIREKSGKTYSYLFSKNAKAYILNAGVLPSGEYRYLAKTKFGKNNYQAEGQFIVNAQDLELKRTNADHQLMYALASQTAGEIVYPDQIGEIPNLIKSNETVKTIVYEDRTYDELINFKVLFFLLISFLTIEWFIRKRNGEI